MNMPKKVTMEGSLQSCRGFVQSKRKGFSQVVHWKKTGVDLRSHKLDQARFPKNVWKKITKTFLFLFFFYFLNLWTTVFFTFFFF
jgi:hypothetical protein